VSQAKLRIIVADGNPLFLQNLVLLLATEYEVVATAADGRTALELIRRFQPDLVVLDLRVATLNGIEIARELAGDVPSPPVIICSVETDLGIVDAARKAGALAYVFKARLRKDLLQAVKSAAQGKPFVSPAR
jgi:DNA-binding NarL/FixJ family response regulator